MTEMLDTPVEYRYAGETYVLTLIGPGLYQVKLNENTGYLGVNTGGTKHSPFAYTLDPGKTCQEGITDGEPANAYLPNALNQVCRILMHEHEHRELQREFDREQAAEEMRHAMTNFLNRQEN